MLWDFGFRFHPECQTKFIEGNAGLITLATIVSEAPKVENFDQLAEEFLRENNPALLEKIRSCPDGERKEFLANIEKSISDLTAMAALFREGEGS